MYGMGAISDEDKLDADEAKKVLRRTARMAKPFRRTVAAALAFTALSTLGVVLGPVILGWAIDNGITPPGDTEVLRNAVIFYLLLTVTAYLAARQQYILINRAGEGFLRVVAHPRVRPHPEAVAGVLRPQQVGCARRPHDLRRRVDGRTGAVRSPPVRVGDPARRVRAGARPDHLVAADARRGCS